MNAMSEALRRQATEWDDALLAEVVAELRDRGGDSEAIEVKSAAGGCPDVAATLTAFANMPDGGLLVLGLTDPGFKPVGLDDVASLEASVAAVAREAVSPPIQCAFATASFENTPVLICRVRPLPLADRPARTQGVAYLRQSDGDYEMSEQEIAHIGMLRSTAQQRTHSDRSVVPGATVADLDKTLLTSYLNTTRSSSRRMADVSDETIMRWTNVTTNEGAITVAGYYALAQYPQQHLPHLTVTAATHLPPGVSGRHRNLSHFDGPLPEQLEAAVQWVIRNTGSTMHYDERGHGYDSYDIPLAAVREIIANALVHRSLDPTMDSKSIDIRLIADRLVITSPGGLWGISVRQLGTPMGRSAVNPALYEMCKRIRLSDDKRVIEGEGGGIREAQQAIAQAGLREPRFIDAGVRFTAILWSHSLLSDEELSRLALLPGVERLSSTQRAIVAALMRGETFSNAEIRDTYGPLDSVEVRRLMTQLVDSDLASSIGTKGNTRYQAGPVLLQEESDQPEGNSQSIEEQMLACAATPVSMSELQEKLGLTKAQARQRIAVLREKGLLKLIGDSPRTAQYVATRS